MDSSKRKDRLIKAAVVNSLFKKKVFHKKFNLKKEKSKLEWNAVLDFKAIKKK